MVKRTPQGVDQKVDRCSVSAASTWVKGNVFPQGKLLNCSCSESHLAANYSRTKELFFQMRKKQKESTKPSLILVFRMKALILISGLSKVKPPSLVSLSSSSVSCIFYLETLHQELSLALHTEFSTVA